MPQSQPFLTLLLFNECEDVIKHRIVEGNAQKGVFSTGKSVRPEGKGTWGYHRDKGALTMLLKRVDTLFGGQFVLNLLDDETEKRRTRDSVANITWNRFCW